MTLSRISIRNKDSQTSENPLDSEGMSFVIATKCTICYNNKARGRLNFIGNDDKLWIYWEQ